MCFRYFGAKSKSLRAQMYAHFPKTYCAFVDAFAGSGKVLLNSPRIAQIEVLNEFNPDIAHVFRMVQTRGKELFDYRRGFEGSDEDKAYFKSLIPANDIERAAKTINSYELSRSGIKDATYRYVRAHIRQSADITWECRKRYRLGVNRLLTYSNRIQNVVILCGDWTGTLQYDSVNTFYYLDPPYVHSSRVSKSVYSHEFTNEQHIEMCKRLTSVKGKVMLSGYGNPIYRHYLRGWREVLLDSYNRSSHAKKLKKSDERIWMNY